MIVLLFLNKLIGEVLPKKHKTCVSQFWCVSQKTPDLACFKYDLQQQALCRMVLDEMADIFLELSETLAGNVHQPNH